MPQYATTGFALPFYHHWFKLLDGGEDPVALLPETTAPMLEIADLEEVAWGRLREAAQR